VLALEPKNEVVKSQMVSTQKLLRRIEFEKVCFLFSLFARGGSDTMMGDRRLRWRKKRVLLRGVERLSLKVSLCGVYRRDNQHSFCTGGCFVDTSYTGPVLPQHPTDPTKYTITHQFIQSMISWFKQGKTLHRRYVWEIVLGAYEYFVQEGSLVDVELGEGVTCDVIGDVHGQFYDMLHLYGLTGEPGEKHYVLMNGDLVDRGSWSVEVILLAFAYKCKGVSFFFLGYFD
jgi:serine/threonine-protein phosphatase 5